MLADIFTADKCVRYRDPRESLPRFWFDFDMDAAVPAAEICIAGCAVRRCMGSTWRHPKRQRNPSRPRRSVLAVRSRPDREQVAQDPVTTGTQQ